MIIWWNIQYEEELFRMKIWKVFWRGRNESLIYQWYWRYWKCEDIERRMIECNERKRKMKKMKKIWKYLSICVCASLFYSNWLCDLWWIPVMWRMRKRSMRSRRRRLIGRVTDCYWMRREVTQCVIIYCGPCMLIPGALLIRLLLWLHCCWLGVVEVILHVVVGSGMLRCCCCLHLLLLLLFIVVACFDLPCCWLLIVFIVLLFWLLLLLLVLCCCCVLIYCCYCWWYSIVDCWFVILLLLLLIITVGCLVVVIRFYCCCWYILIRFITWLVTLMYWCVFILLLVCWRNWSVIVRYSADCYYYCCECYLLWHWLQLYCSDVIVIRWPGIERRALFWPLPIDLLWWLMTHSIYRLLLKRYWCYWCVYWEANYYCDHCIVFIHCSVLLLILREEVWWSWWLYSTLSYCCCSSVLLIVFCDCWEEVLCDTLITVLSEEDLIDTILIVVLYCWWSWLFEEVTILFYYWCDDTVLYY